MNAALALREAARPIVGVHPDLDDTTPAELFESGDHWATDSLMRWARQEENEQFILDVFCERNASFHRDQAIQQWSKSVIAGDRT
ncbi:MAG: hypothetical protein L0J73_04040 [Halomonas sp.]|nr:hypothetical protein [Halomonas sp.]